jgi:hypothetical protein
MSPPCCIVKILVVCLRGAGLEMGIPRVRGVPNGIPVTHSPPTILFVPGTNCENVPETKPSVILADRSPSLSQHSRFYNSGPKCNDEQQPSDARRGQSRK